MARRRFTLGQLLKGVAIIAVLLGLVRLCACDPELAGQLVPLFSIAAFFAAKALFVLILFGLLAVSRLFDSEEEREEIQRIRSSPQTRCDDAGRVQGGQKRVQSSFNEGGPQPCRRST